MTLFIIYYFNLINQLIIIGIQINIAFFNCCYFFKWSIATPIAVD